MRTDDYMGDRQATMTFFDSLIYVAAVIGAIVTIWHAMKFVVGWRKKLPNLRNVIRRTFFRLRFSVAGLIARRRWGNRAPICHWCYENKGRGLIPLREEGPDHWRCNTCHCECDGTGKQVMSRETREKMEEVARFLRPQRW